MPAPTMLVRTLLWAVLIGLALAAAACSRPLPTERPSQILYRDLERLVTVKATAGWTIDRLELEDILPGALMSVCQVEPTHHRALLAWIDENIAMLGGPVEQAYQDRGQDLGEVGDLLRLTRVRMLLELASTSAAEDCPFWLTPKLDFAGRQISDNRWQISLGGGGRGNVFLEGDTLDLEVGGASRALFGRVLEQNLALYVGLEFGGGGSAPKDSGGNRTNLQVVFEGVVPVVARYYMLNTFIEGELGYLARATEEDWRDIEHGIHVGMFIGARATRVRWFFPGAGFGLAYERTFPKANQGDPLNMIKLGFRASFDIDL